MADDVFGDSDGDDELVLASKEFERDLERIENAAFHDAFEETRDKLTQQSFDAGYEIAFEYFEKIGQLKGFNDVLIYKIQQDEAHEQIKSQISELYMRLDRELEQQMKSNVEQKLYEISEAKMTNIKPSNEFINEFNQIKAKIIECARLANSDFAQKFIEEINKINF
ncbi:hypothetical protein DERP_002170 [Dermatophagoides pteronyssinus]|uniref:Uncharacterized protein n=1 Tax=Dermatophagoides pteronyssinus TaxID=6956 RepID=A0ABQ8JGY4_DERPT|nr:hypothetical protein DERP_002170 [Dermatophagoides pteronyssinus]